MLEKNAFLDNKGITDGFICNIVSGFITRYTELYGDVFSFESLRKRLHTHLNSMNLIDPSKHISDSRYHKVVDTYEVFKKNSIIMYIKNKKYLLTGVELTKDSVAKCEKF